MRNDVKHMVSNCMDCLAYLPSKPSPPLTQTKASRPFEIMSVDLAYFEGDHYLVNVDRFSGWPNVEKLKKLDTSAVTSQLEDWNYDFGKPERLRTDGGPQFRSEFKEWCEENGIIHELSSPEHHQSNGHAENAVKHMKYLLGKVKGDWPSFRKALLEYRNTPRSSDGLSPAQWAFGYRQRSEAPALANAYKRLNDQDFYAALDRREDTQAKVKSDFDRNRKPDSILPDGTNVIIQRKRKNGKTGRWDQKGTIVSKRPEGNSYNVNIGGQVRVRSRLFLRPISDSSTEETSLPAEDETRIVEPRRVSKRNKKKTQRYGL